MINLKTCSISYIVRLSAMVSVLNLKYQFNDLKAFSNMCVGTNGCSNCRFNKPTSGGRTGCIVHDRRWNITDNIQIMKII